MMIYKFTLPFLVIVALLSGCSSKEPITPKKEFAQKVHAIPLENFHKVDQKLYRSAQPNAKEFAQLIVFGIENDLNLRQWHDDEDELEGLDICYYHVPINTSKMSYEQLVEAVAFLSHSKGKTLVHCLHGSDRTGTVVAGYRIAIEGWSKEKAIEEFTQGGFGYHAFWFPNLPKLLDSLDVEQFQKDIKNYKFTNGMCKKLAK